jgi:molecular chaperone DnaK
MVRQAEINKAADQRRKELVEARNQADSLAYGAERSLRDLDGKVGAEDRRALEQLIAEVRRTAQGEDVTGIRDAMTRLQQASGRLAEGAYGSDAGGRPGGNGHSHDAPSGSGEGEDVVEGEFRQV